MLGLGHRPGAHGRQVRTRLRFGQVHRARPFAADELRQKAALQLVRAVRLERFRRPGGQQRAKRKAQIGRVPHLDRRGSDQPGQPLPAIFWIAAEAVPAVLDKPAVCRRKPVGRDDPVLCQRSALLVTGLVERRQYIAGELCRLLENRPDQIRRDFLIARQRGQSFEPRQLGDHELHILQRRAVIRHGGALGGASMPARTGRNSWYLALPVPAARRRRCRFAAPAAPGSRRAACSFPRRHEVCRQTRIP